MGDVVILSCVTTLDTPADRVLEAAIGKLDHVVILGYDKDGEEYFAANFSDGGEVLWHMERAKMKLLGQVK
jgi:hypothetical protein